MNKIDACLSLKLIENYDLTDTVIVIIDVVRASTTITTALASGVAEILPLDNVEDTLKLKPQGYMLAGERNGDKISGFDTGNSPFYFVDNQDVKGRRVAITTTNGTRTLKIAEKNASKFKNTEIIIGTFVNSNAVKEYLQNKNKNVLLVCSGWKSALSIEDTLFAGKMATDLLEIQNYEIGTDGAAHSMLLYNLAKDNLFDFVMTQSVRFKKMRTNLINDIKFCLKTDVFDCVPVFENGKIVLEI